MCFVHWVRVGEREKEREREMKVKLQVVQKIGKGIKR